MTSTEQGDLRDEPAEALIPAASRRRRIAAFFVDYILFSFLSASAFIVLFISDFIDDSAMKMSDSAVSAATLLALLVYFNKDVFSGVSLGRWMLGVAVRDGKDPLRSPSSPRLFFRNVFLTFWPVELIALLTSPERRRLGDRLVGTWVVRQPSSASRALRISLLLTLILSGALLVTRSMSIALRDSQAYEVAKAALREDESIRSRTGGVLGFGELPIGSVSLTEGRSIAKILVTVSGAAEDSTVLVELSREAGQGWRVDAVGEVE